MPPGVIAILLPVPVWRERKTRGVNAWVEPPCHLTPTAEYCPVNSIYNLLVILITSMRHYSVTASTAALFTPGEPVLPYDTRRYSHTHFSGRQTGIKMYC